MKAVHSYSLFIFVFATALIAAKPCFIFTSAAVRASYEKEARMFGLTRVVRKRSEHIYTHEEFAITDDYFQKLNRIILPIPVLFLRKWLAQVLFFISAFFSYFLSRTKKVESFFEVSPHNDHYLSLSVFRI